MNILALLQTNLSGISKTTLRQMNQIITAMLSMTVRITMKGISRWAGEGGSYRTIQRFYYTTILWAQVLWQFFCQTLFQTRQTYLALDGHFGNYPAFYMVRQCGLHLISKLRWDAALCFPYTGLY